MRLIAVAGVLAAAALGAAPALATPARLVLTSDGGVTTMNADGSDRTRLTPAYGADLIHTGPTQDWQPQWTPDGRAIVFTRYHLTLDYYGFEEDARGRVLAMRPDGSGLHPLLPDANRTDEESVSGFTPRGRVLVERHRKSGRAALYEVDLDGSPVRELHGPLREVLLYSNDFAYSPDGRRILYTQYRLDEDEYVWRPDLYTARADGTGRRELVKDAGFARYSPDGRRIAVVSVRDRNGLTNCVESCDQAGEIYVMDPDGDHARRLTRSEGTDEQPTWSPDGRRIAFHSDRNVAESRQFEIYSVEPDGDCLTWLTNGSAVSSHADWRPHGGDSDPGGCGGTSRPALVDIDLSPLAKKRFPVYWLGPRLPGGRLLYYLQTSGGFASLGWYDCAFFEEERCGAGASIDSVRACDVAADLLLEGRAGDLSLRRHALVSSPAPGTDDRHIVYTGRAAVEFWFGFRYVDRLRPWPDRTAPAELPEAAFPKWFWRKLEEAEDAFARTHDDAVTAKELGISRRAVQRRRALARRLRGLGVDGVLPHCAEPRDLQE